MKKLISLLLMLPLVALGQDAGRILTGSAQPPLPFNIIPQPGFENQTTGWGITGGTFTTVTAASDVARGKYSGKWTQPASTVAGVVLQSDNVSIPPGLYAHSCRAQILYRGNALTNGALTLEAYDGTNILGTTALSNVATYTYIQTSIFTCPSSGSLRLRVRNTATTPSSVDPIYFDEAIIADSLSIGDGTGIVAVANFGSTPNAQGGSVSGTSLVLQPADGTHPGGITSGTQTIGGAKTFSSAPTLSSLSTGVIHSDSGGALSSSTIVNADVSASAAIVDTKLATISTAGKVANSATTATNANTASAIVSRDASGNFSAGTISSALTGNVTGNVSGTASALAANPTDCGSTSFARQIDAQGNLTCFQVNLSSDTNGTPLPILNGGTGFSNKDTAFNALSPVTAKGDLIAGDGSFANVRLPIGTNGQVLTVDTAQTSDLKWATPTGGAWGTITGTLSAQTDLQSALDAKLGLHANADTATALATNPTDCSANNYATTIDALGNLTCAQVSLSAGVTSTLPIANGGTGQATATAAFTALSPLTTKGDITAYSTLPIRVGIGTNGQVLTADSTAAPGLKWAAPAGGSWGTITGTLSSQTDLQSALDAKLSLSGGTMSGAIAMGTSKITGLGTPTVSTDAATKGYVDSTSGNPLTTKGDLFTYSTLADRLGVGTNGQVLTADSGEATGLKWATVSGTGDVVGPGSSTDNAISRFDGTTGKLIQDSGATLDDSGHLSTTRFLGTDNINSGDGGTAIAEFDGTSSSGTGNGNIENLNLTFASSAANPAAQITGISNTVIYGHGSQSVVGSYTNVTGSGVSTGADVFGTYINAGGGGTFGNYYGLFVAGAGNGSISGVNHALHVDAGTSYFGGTVNVDGLTPSRLIATDASKNLSSFSAGTSTTLLHGNASGLPTYSSVVNADISASASIDYSKLAPLLSGDILVGSAGNVATDVAMSGDVTISNLGVTAIGASKVTNTMLAGSIADSKLSTISTAGKVSNSATTATSANTASTIVARDASNNFTAGTITAALTGNASTATALAANPSDCAAGTKATAIDASGNLTCSAVALSTDVSGTLAAAQFPALTGDVTTSSGALATTLAATSNATIASLDKSTGVAIHGSTSNSAAAAGYIGEYVESVVTATNFPTSTQYGDLTSISLTAGDWEITLEAQGQLNGATMTTMDFFIGQTSGNSSTGRVQGSNTWDGSVPTAAHDQSAVVSSFRTLLSGTTTIYLKYRATYSAGTPQALGRLSARRQH